MKNHWLYLEPYTFLFKKGSHSLVYNTIANQGRKFNNTGKLEEIVKQLNDESNMYCVDIKETDLEDPNLLDFINYIHNTYSGDLIVNSFSSKRPVIFFPKFKINKTIEQLQETDYKLTSDDILSYLNELSIYIGGSTPSSMLSNIAVYKQFDYCRDLGNKQLPLDTLLSFTSQIRHAPLSVVNILGGNIFTYPELLDFAENIKNLYAFKIYNACYNDVPCNLDQYKFLSDEKTKLKVLVDFPLNTEKIDQIISTTKSFKIETEWLFAITSEDEFEETERLIAKKSLGKTTIKPVYTGTNHSFFTNNVYLDEEDILNTRLSRDDIFVKQILNTYDFGKLILMPNGNVYANPNHQPIGKIDGSALEMILNEMSSNNSWRRIRNQKPCTDCVYQWLCPSPSNYELAIDKENLCSVI